METKGVTEKRERREDVFSRYVRAGKRTYFFDVKTTRAEDYYLTITESTRRYNDDGTFQYEKHRLFLYKEDFEKFSNRLSEVMEYIIREKGVTPIRNTEDRPQTTGSTSPTVKTEAKESTEAAESTEVKTEVADSSAKSVTEETGDAGTGTKEFTDVSFDDLGDTATTSETEQVEEEAEKEPSDTVEEATEISEDEEEKKE